MLVRLVILVLLPRAEYKPMALISLYEKITFYTNHHICISIVGWMRDQKISGNAVRRNTQRSI